MRSNAANRRTLIAGAGVGVLIVLAAVLFVVHASSGTNGSSTLDVGLKRTADRVLPQLSHPSTKLPITDASLKSFQAWVYDLQPVLARIVASQRGTQWEQLLMSDPNTLPPQTPLVNVPEHPPVAVDPSVVAQALKTGQGQYATAQQSGRSVRVYVVSFDPPQMLKDAQMQGVLEVIQPEP